MSFDEEVRHPYSERPTLQGPSGHQRLEAMSALDCVPPMDGYERPEWMRAAACKTVGASLFFATDGGITDAKKVCEGCPVKETCLEYALSHNEQHGVWGGTSERERRRIRRNRKAVA